MLGCAGIGALLADHNWAQYSRILDIGGSTGSLVAAVIDGVPMFKGDVIVCDLDKVSVS